MDRMPTSPKAMGTWTGHEVKICICRAMQPVTELIDAGNQCV